MDKLLTIVTVCYNSEKTIENCIKSVVRQLTDEMEYLIVDGASKDKTLEIIKRYTENNIRFISEKDSGIYDAMNKGINHALGQYVWFINSDDVLRDNILNTIISLIKEYKNIDCIYGDMEYIRNINGEKYSEIKKAPAEKDLNGLEHEMVLFHPSSICKVQSLKEIKGFNTNYKIVADWDLLLRLYKNNYKFKHVDNVLSSFYCGGASGVWHNHERHLIRKNNHSYCCIDWYYVKDEVKRIVLTQLKPICQYILKKRTKKI